MNKNTEISERVCKIIDYTGLSKNEFSKKLGYDRAQSIYDIANGKSAPSYDFFNKLLNSEFSDLFNHDWLLTGKGNMLKAVDNIRGGYDKIMEKTGLDKTMMVMEEISRLDNRDVEDLKMENEYLSNKIKFLEKEIIMLQNMLDTFRKRSK